MSTPTDMSAPTDTSAPADAIEAEGLSVRYGARRVLEGVALRVSAGEFVGLLGPNGAGKSTLLRLLLGLQRPESGRVLLGGAPLGSLSRREAARRAAFVPQQAPTELGFTVREMVAMGRTPHLGRFRPEGEADRGAIEAAMRHADLLGMEERPYWALSGGERARVLLARALAQAAPILLLDEPTASLDLRHAFELLELVRSRAEAGLAALAALHDLSFAARFCDRLLVLDGARIVAEGPPEEVLTKALLAEVFGVRAELIRRGGSLLLDVQGRA